MSFIINSYRNEAAGGGAFIPTDVTSATAISWWDATDASTIQENTVSGRVSDWDDKVGSNDSVQAAEGDQPFTGTRTIGGKATLEGLNSQFLRIAADIVLTPPYTIIMVGQTDTFGNTDYWLGKESFDSGFAFRTTAGQVTIARSGAGGTLTLTTGTTANATPYVVLIRCDAAGVYDVYLNGDANFIEGMSLGTQNFNLRNLVAGDNSAARGLDGLIGNIEVYSGEIDNADANSRCNQLADDFSISWTDIT